MAKIRKEKMSKKALMAKIKRILKVIDKQNKKIAKMYGEWKHE
jgi:hypothetical protein